jgi:predicted nucleic-acid-binding protein
MIGLDTNVVLRYLLQDDPDQSVLVNRIFERRISASDPGFINLAVVLEFVLVLRGVFKQTPIQIASCLEALLTTDSLTIQNEQQVFEAVFALKRGTAEFEDALIGALNAHSGCAHTLTFDRKAARLPLFKAMT